MHDWYQSSTSTVNACIGAPGSDGRVSGTGTERIPAWRVGVVTDIFGRRAENTLGPADVQTGLAPRSKGPPNDQPWAASDLAGRGAQAIVPPARAPPNRPFGAQAEASTDG